MQRYIHVSQIYLKKHMKKLMKMIQNVSMLLVFTLKEFRLENFSQEYTSDGYQKIDKYLEEYGHKIYEKSTK